MEPDTRSCFLGVITKIFSKIQMTTTTSQAYYYTKYTTWYIRVPGMQVDIQCSINSKIQ